MENEELIMKFEPNTIEHLGIKMYSHLPNAIAELIANAYDACATEVNIKLYDNEDGKKIIVEDDGHGMTFKEINEYFLRIGRNRRKEEGNKAPCGRFVTGKKGLGKLAFFGIGKTIEIITKKGAEKTEFNLDWDEMITSRGEYRPTYKISSCDESETGTTIVLTNLKRKSDFDIGDLATSLSKLFNFNDADFIIMLSLNDGEPIVVDRTLKYRNLEKQIEWSFPEYSSGMDVEYEYKDRMYGKIITTKKPIRPSLRGITLFANGRLINLPEFFGAKESSHFYSYATGWLDVDFADMWDEDVISTDRQSINWELDKTEELRNFLKKCVYSLERDWRAKRKKEKRKKVKEKSKIDVDTWVSTQTEETKEKLDDFISSVMENPAIDEDESMQIIENVHTIAPEYADYHWRYLHESIRDVCKTYYENEDYFHAATEAVKYYIEKVRELSGISSTINKSDESLMGQVFGSKSGILLVTDNSDMVEEDIENGQRALSQGVVMGFKNPVASHATIKRLLEKELFTEKDCLDILSLVSHLFRRLDNAKKRAREEDV